MEEVYYGEHQCQNVSKTSHKRCGNKAYFRSKKKNAKLLLCGVHSRNVSRKELPKRDRATKARMKQERLQAHESLVQAAREDNASKGLRGQVVLSRLRMMHEPENLPGFLKVFPNFKHQNRKDGFGCSRLSPKAMGPVEHGQPSLPAALNIENFHQGSKVFREEVDSDNNPGPLFYEHRVSFYRDHVPHRHKYKGQGANANVPLYFLWVDKDGTEHRLDYITSRQFYCNFYERIAAHEKDYLYLLDQLQSGTNLQICGYDAFPIENSIEAAYLDPSVPFGHERVLYTMLVHPDDPGAWPWRKHKTFDF